VIATGGHAPAIVPFCSEIETIDELLTLTGLQLIWKRNR
jgi:pantothenate kinase type III